MHVLVTGCSGFVGTNLVPRLRTQGHQVTGIDRKPILLPSNEIDDFIHGDLKDPDVLKRGFESKVDHVMHLAAAKDDFGISDEEFFEENVGVTKRLIDVGRAQGVKQWFFYSSVAAMGLSGATNGEPADESAPLEPYNAYGSSKAEAEELFRQMAAEDPETQIVLFRPAIIYGPGNFTYTNMYRLIDGLYRRRFTLVGKGETIKTRSYIHNTVDATLFLMDRMKPGVQTFVYVDEEPMTSADIVRHVSTLLGRKPPTFYIPVGFAKAVASVFDVGAKLTGVNFPITAARINQFRTPTNFAAPAIRALGFRQVVPTDEALAQTVAWYHEQRSS